MHNPLTVIPGVGKITAHYLNDIDIFRVEELKGNNPQALYEKMCEKQRFTIDRCMLYVLRCAVYYASTEKPEKELLKWWNWKNKN